MIVLDRVVDEAERLPLVAAAERGLDRTHDTAVAQGRQSRPHLQGDVAGKLRGEVLASLVPTSGRGPFGRPPRWRVTVYRPSSSAICFERLTTVYDTALVGVRQVSTLVHNVLNKNRPSAERSYRRHATKERRRSRTLTIKSRPASARTVGAARPSTADREHNPSKAIRRAPEPSKRSERARHRGARRGYCPCASMNVSAGVGKGSRLRRRATRSPSQSRGWRRRPESRPATGARSSARSRPSKPS
jgi:hypothetical protein